MGAGASFTLFKKKPGRRIQPEPPGRRLGPVFGVPLPVLRDTGQLVSGVPWVLRDMVELLDKHALQQKGLFRLSGSVVKTGLLRARCDRGEAVGASAAGDLQTVASLLKLFLRELPLGVIPAPQHAELARCFRECTGELALNQMLKQKLNSLPEDNFNILSFLCHFLLRVASHSQVNHMSVENLATIFGPCLFHVPQGPSMLEEQSLCNAMVSHLLKNHCFLMGGDLDTPSPPPVLLALSVPEEKGVNHTPTTGPCVCDSSAEAQLPGTVETWLPGTVQTQLLNTTETQSPDTSQQQLLDTAETQLLDTAKTELPDTAETQFPDTSEPQLPDITETQLPDTAETQLPDTAETQLLNTAETQLPDTAETQLLNTAEIQVLNTAETQLLNTAEIQVVNTAETQLLNTAEIQVVNTAEAQSPDTSETQLPDKAHQALRPFQQTRDDAGRQSRSAGSVTEGEDRVGRTGPGPLWDRAAVENQESPGQDRTLQPQRPESCSRPISDPQGGFSQDTDVSGDLMDLRGDAGAAENGDLLSPDSPHMDRVEHMLREDKEMLQACDQGSLIQLHALEEEVCPPAENTGRTANLRTANLTPLPPETELHPAPSEKGCGGQGSQGPSRLLLHITDGASPRPSPRCPGLTQSQRFHSDPETAPSPPCSQPFIKARPIARTQLPEGSADTPSISLLTKHIQALKRKIRQFEEQFEQERNYRPSHSDKAVHSEVLQLMSDLAKSRKQLRDLRLKQPATQIQKTDGPADFSRTGSDLQEAPEPSQKPSLEDTPSQKPSLEDTPSQKPSLEDTPSQKPSLEDTPSQKPSLEDTPSQKPSLEDTPSQKPSLEDTLEALQKRLREKRQALGLPDNMKEMTQKQMALEKITLQKCLLYFESLHGRPGTKHERSLMKPLYDRYRTVKQLLCTPSAITTIAEEDSSDDDSTQGGSLSSFRAPRPQCLDETACPQEDDSDTVFVSPLDEVKAASQPATVSNLHEASRIELLQCLRETRAERRRLRQGLREFEEHFHRQMGRATQKDDRIPMAEEYQEYKSVKAKLRLLEALLSKQETPRII